jgi:hypothetical protein
VDRERSLWLWAWRTPQAAAWAAEPWRWQRRHVGPDLRASARRGAAADKNSLHRFADQIGMTPAGLKMNGWKIASDQLAEKRAEKAPAPSAPTARDRMRALRGAAGQ